MSDERVIDYLRQRGRVTPPHELVATVMAAVEHAPEPRSRFAPYIPAFGAAAVAGVVAVVAAIAMAIGQPDVGPTPSLQPLPSATSATLEELDAAVVAATQQLVDTGGVEGTATSTIEHYLVSATWFDWRPNGDQVVVVGQDVDVAAPWWTDPDGEPLTVGERIETTISVIVGDGFYRTEDGAWVVADRAEAPRGPLTWAVGILTSEASAVPPIEQAAEPTVLWRRLDGGAEQWILEVARDAGRARLEWFIHPDGYLQSHVSEGTDVPIVPDEALGTGATRFRVEFIPLDDPAPIPTPDPDGAPDPADFGLPADFPLAGEREAEIDYRRYVEDVLDYMQAYHWNSAEIDWAAARSAALDGLPADADAAQAHQRIRNAIQTFDFGTVFVRPQDVPPDGGSPGPGPTTLPTAERIGDVGHVVVTTPPSFGTDELRQYLRAARLTMTALEGTTPACGWIVDLREHAGGAWGPPMAVLGGLLGEGRALTFVSGSAEWWLEVDGEGVVTSGGFDESDVLADSPYIDASIDGDEEVTDAFAAEPPYLPQVPGAPVAVLVGTGTVTGGEQATVAFLGRPSTRVFGGPTGASPIVAPNVDMADGAVLWVPTWIPVDRDGTRYTTNVLPNEVVGDTRGIGGDAVLDAAVEWLEGQAGCS